MIELEDNNHCRVACTDCGFDYERTMHGNHTPQDLLVRFERLLENLGWLIQDSYLCPICHDELERKAS